MPTLKRKLILPMHLVMRRNPVPVDHRVRRRLGAQSNRKWARTVFVVIWLFSLCLAVFDRKSPCR